MTTLGEESARKRAAGLTHMIIRVVGDRPSRRALPGSRAVAVDRPRLVGVYIGESVSHAHLYDVTLDALDAWLARGAAR